MWIFGGAFTVYLVNKVYSATHMGTRVVKQGLILTLITAITWLGVLSGCYTNQEDTDTLLLEAYISMADVVMDGNAGTVGGFRIFHLSVIDAAASGDKFKVIESFNNFMDYLERAQKNTSQQLSLLGNNPPLEARTFHMLMTESLWNTQAAFVSAHGWGSQLVNLGYDNRELAERADDCLLQAEKLRLQAKWELDDLKQKVKK